MAEYNRIRATKQSPIGTMMIWTGTVSQSQLADGALPDGWIPCSGQELEAARYPLLAQLLKNTYGPEPANNLQIVGTNYGIVNQYPYFNPPAEDPDHRLGVHVDTFSLPNLNNVTIMDLEGSRLDPVDLSVVGEYITKNGNDADIPPTDTCFVDVNFDIDPSSRLAGTLKGIEIEDPSYFATIRTIPRKLGVDHMPAHAHPQPEERENRYPSPIVSGGYVGVFEAGTYETQNSTGYTTVSPAPVSSQESTADRFNPGTARLTWYDQGAVTLPTVDGFRDYSAALPNVPAIPGSGRIIPAHGIGTVEYEDPNTCIINVQQPATTQPFPNAGRYSGYKNYYTSPSVSPNRGQSELKPYPTTLNHNADTWNSPGIGSHNHFTIELSMTAGQMQIPNTVQINNMTTGTVAPISVPQALSVQINPNTPSLVSIVVIRAY